MISAIATDWRWPPDSARTGSLKHWKCGLSRLMTLRAATATGPTAPSAMLNRFIVRDL
jgi:hypothetical protein